MQPKHMPNAPKLAKSRPNIDEITKNYRFIEIERRFLLPCSRVLKSTQSLKFLLQSTQQLEIMHNMASVSTRLFGGVFKDV